MRIERPLTAEERQLVTDYYDYAIDIAFFRRGAIRASTIDDEGRGIAHAALIEAVQGYDPTKGNLARWVKRIVIGRLADARRIQKKERDRTEDLPGDREDTGVCDYRSDRITDLENEEAFESLIGPCSVTSKDLMRRVYRDKQNYDEIAKDYGIANRSTICIRHRKVIAYIRKHCGVRAA